MNKMPQTANESFRFELFLGCPIQRANIHCSIASISTVRISASEIPEKGKYRDQKRFADGGENIGDSHKKGRYQVPCADLIFRMINDAS